MTLFSNNAPTGNRMLEETTLKSTDLGLGYTMYKKQVLEHFVIKNGEDTRTQTLDILIVKNLFQFANQKCTVVMLGTCRYMIAYMYVKQYRLYLCSFNLTNLQNPPITSFSYA